MEQMPPAKPGTLESWGVRQPDRVLSSVCGQSPNLIDSFILFKESLGTNHLEMHWVYRYCNLVLDGDQ